MVEHAEPPAGIACKWEGRVCALCEAPISEGASIFPFTVSPEGQDGRRPGIVWAHVACHELLRGGFTIPVCRHWRRLGRCPMKEKQCCAFGHPPSNPLKTLTLKTEKKTKWGGKVSRTNRAKQQAHSHAFLPLYISTRHIVIPQLTKLFPHEFLPSPKRRLLQNSFAANCFRIFIAKMFTLDYLKSGVVLDVGGGKGELSWALLNLMGVESVVVDPRELGLSNVEKKWRRGMFQPKRVGSVFSVWNPAVENGSSARDPLVPKHLRVFFKASEVTRLLNDGVPEEEVARWLDGARAQARAVSWTTRGLQHEEEGKEGKEGEEGDNLHEKVTHTGGEVR